MGYWPSMLEGLNLYSASNTLGVVVHTCNPSIPEVEAENQKFKAILRHLGN